MSAADVVMRGVSLIFILSIFSLPARDFRSGIRRFVNPGTGKFPSPSGGLAGARPEFFRSRGCVPRGSPVLKSLSPEGQKERAVGARRRREGVQR